MGADTKFLAKLRQTARQAAEVVRRIKVPSDKLKVVYKACWRVRILAVRHAVTAAENGRDPFKLFCWLCWRKGTVG